MSARRCCFAAILALLIALPAYRILVRKVETVAPGKIEAANSEREDHLVSQVEKPNGPAMEDSLFNGSMPEVRGNDMRLPSAEQERAFGQLLASIENKRSPWEEPALRDLSRYRFQQSAVDSSGNRLQAVNPLHGFEVVAGSEGIRLYQGAAYPFQAGASGNQEEELFRMGIQLRSFAQAETRVEAEQPDFSGSRERLRRTHGTGVVEWWINNPTGLEHGFIVERPINKESPKAEMRFDLELETSLTPVFDSQRQEIVFLDDSQSRAMTYSKLLVSDANDKELPARMECQKVATSDQDNPRMIVSLVVDVREAAFPVVIDPTISSQLLKDIGTDVAVFEDGAAVIGNSILFPAFSDASGMELWISDGTESGTFLLKDIYPGRASSFPMHFISIGSKVLFKAFSPGFGEELWCSDGTREGTKLLADIYNGEESGYTIFHAVFKERLYFYAEDFDGENRTGGELWSSDGTSEGTAIVRDITVGEGSSSLSGFVVLNDALYFSALGMEEVGQSYSDLWKIEEIGAEVQLSRIGLDQSVGLAFGLTRIGDQLFFTASHNEESSYKPPVLWKSDGTAEGTLLVKDVEVRHLGSDFPTFWELNDQILFVGNEVSNDHELWITDGSSEGTKQLKDINVGDHGSDPREFVATDNRLFFAAFDGNFESGVGHELWMTDGTEDGTVLVEDIYQGTDGSFPSQLTAIGDQLFFVALGHDGSSETGLELFAVDESGELRMEELFEGEGSADPQDLLELGGALYFSAQSSLGGTVAGRDLWMSDGASPMTLHTDYPELEGASFPGFRFDRGNGDSFVFIGEPGNGGGLWLFDSQGRTFRKVSNLGLLDYSSGHQVALGRLGDELLFSATSVSAGEELWKTDGTSVGTVLVKDIYPGERGSFIGTPVKLGDVILFSAEDSNGRELWRSDGTNTGTVMVKDIFVGSSSSNPLDKLVFNGVAYFSATTEALGSELWRSDGTESGTYMVKDIYQGSEGSGASDWAEFNGSLYFAAKGSVGGESIGYELWKTDGTEEGTVLVKDIVEGSNGSFPDEMTVLGDVFLFKAHTDLGPELWKSDGTKGGTVLVKDFALGSEQGSPSGLIEFEGNVYFSAFGYDGTDYTGVELWKSDGTEEGTVMVRDISPGEGHSFPYGLLKFGGELYFSADQRDDSNSSGAELWETDGTSDGTTIVRDIYVGANGSEPRDFFVANGKLFFTAIGFDGETRFGRELWMSDGTSEGTSMVEDLYYGEGDSRYSFLDQRGSLLYLSADNGQHGREIRVLDTTPRSDPPIPLVDIISIDEAGVSLRYETLPDYHYQVQTAEGLVGSLWSVVGPVVEGQGQAVSFVDGDRPSFDSRFYRIQVCWPPLDLTVVVP